MARKNFYSQDNEKKSLGRHILSLRNDKNMSLRNFAKSIGIPPSNVTYIENGINAPTANVYRKIIGTLTPPSDILEEMDYLYSEIRKVPPPDVCEVLIQNKKLGDKIKMFNDTQLSPEQIKSIGDFFSMLKNDK